MKMHTFCPRCGTEFTSEHHSLGHVVCACGWIDETPVETASKSTEKKSIRAMAAFAIVFVAGFAHLGSWGSHAFSIPFTKIAQITGTLSADGYRQLAQTCIDLNKWSCAEGAYMDLATSRGDVEGLAQLGSLEARLNKPAQAVAAYQAYEKHGGSTATSLVAYGKVLEAMGNDAEAIRVYEKSIVAKPDALPIQATTGIVRLMMKQGRYAEAYSRILAFHDSAENAKGYMNTEAAQLEKQLGETAVHQLEQKQARSTEHS